MTVRLKVKYQSVRATIDSGASRSIIDKGTLEWLNIDDILSDGVDVKLMDASNNQMDMAGRCFITFKISKLNKTYTHKFWVLNTQTYKTLLLGRILCKK